MAENLVMNEPLVTDDLTGWTWVANETLYTPTGSDASYELSYALNYESSDQNFTSLNLYGENTTDVKSISVEYSGTSYKSVFDGEALSEMSIWYDENGNETTYELTPWKGLHFTGGTDVTNTDAIRWLQDNGALTPPQTNITLDLSTIGLPAGSHLIQIKLSDDGVTKADSELSNSVTYVEPEPLPQLDTPTNLTADGTNIEFDEVENAEEYEIFADGVSIGTHMPVPPSKIVVTGQGSQSPSNVHWTIDSEFSFDFEQVTVDGNVFIKIPTMYRKVDTVVDGQITGFTIADAQIDSSYQPYSVFVKEDGVTVMPYVLIGKYCSSSAVGSNLNSVARKSPVTRAIGEARTYARAVGTGYQQFDWQFQKLWQDLICAKIQTININSGGRIEVDQLGIVWNKSGTWTDGLACLVNDSNWVFSYKPSQYVDSPSADTIGYQSAGYAFPTTSVVEISKLGYDSNNPFFNQPTATTSNISYNTYYCVGWWYLGNGPARPALTIDLSKIEWN